MLQFLPVFEGNTIAIRASGKLTHEDYQAFLPKLEEQIKELGKVSVLLELDNFSGWDIEAAKDDFHFGMQHQEDIIRFAIVGDKAWERWMTLMVKPFMPSGSIRFFTREELQEAWDWLREPERLEKKSEQITPYQNIIAGVDFSLHSKHAVKRALELAEHYHATLTLLHVVPEIVPYPAYYGDSITGYIYDPELLAKQNQELIELGEKQLQEYISTLKTALNIRPEVISGETAKTILSYLEAQNVDLAIFGSKQRKGLSRLLGSTPRYIQDHARCEILVVPFEDKIRFNTDKDTSTG